MVVRAALSALKGRRLPTLGRLCSRSGRRIIEPVDQLISKRLRETETKIEVEKALRTDAASISALVMHSDVLEKLSKNEVNMSHNDDKQPIVFYGNCYRDHPPKAAWITVVSLDDDCKVLPKYDIFPPYPIYQYSSVGICNGVFCYFGYGDQIWLWNPATNEVKVLQPPTSGASFLSLDIWFDDKSQDYKVVKAIEHAGTRKAEIELYSVRSDSWKKIPCPVFCDGLRVNALINGVYYMVAYREEGEVVILAFDISTETISYLPLHQHGHAIVEEKGGFNNMITFDGASLHLLDYNGLLSALSRAPDGACEHWVMMSDGSWHRLSVFHACGVGHPLRFSRNGELLFFRRFATPGQFVLKLLVFDFATGKLKDIDDCGSHRLFKLLPFSESSVKLNGVSGPEFTSWITRKIKQDREREEDEDEDDYGHLMVQ